MSIVRLFVVTPYFIIYELAWDNIVYDSNAGVQSFSLYMFSYEMDLRAYLLVHGFEFVYKQRCRVNIQLTLSYYRCE